MTGKNTSKLKSVLIMILAALLSLSLMMVAACGTSEDEDNDDPTYSIVETDEQELTNGNFEFGTSSADAEDFPYTSATGWTRAIDNSAATSRVNSGIIDTSKFDTLIETLLDNSTFSDWAVDKYSIDKEALEEEAKTELGTDADEEEIEEWVDAKITETVKSEFANPGTPTGAEGSKIFMLNNYIAEIGVGTAQRLTSSKTVTLQPGTYGKFSVWVLTNDLTPATGEDYGANIKITSTVAGVTQSEYRLSNIKADAWTQYTVYVKANDFAETTVRLVLGLGYGAGKTSAVDNCVEGTVYFDNAAYEELETLPDGVTMTPDKIALASSTSSDKQEATVENNTAYLDLTSENYFQALSGFTLNLDDTKSNTAASYIPAGATKSSTTDTNGFTVTQSKNSTTAKLEHPSFNVAPGDYMLVRFDLGMTLDKLQRSGLTVYVFDKYGTEENNQVTLSGVILTEDNTYTLIVRNNFDATTAPETREFYLSFVFGPVNVATTTDATYYTTGSYTVKNLTTQTGSMDEDDYNENDPAYNIYSLISGTVDSSSAYSLAAYAGWTSDFTEESDSETYSLKVAYSDSGTIINAPAKSSEYTGIKDYRDPYTSEEYNGFAGLVNTKYLSNYGAITGLTAEALNWKATDDNIQPLMINNVTADNYGYVSSIRTLGSDSYASASVRVRVTGDAAAYIYLVNTAKGDELLNVMNQQFTADNGTEYNNDLYVRVTADMMKADGWLTVNFYIASGADELSYRLEMWNGERYTADTDSATVPATSQGLVFFNDISFGSSFDEASVLAEAEKETITYEDKVFFTRKLTETEIKFNNEQKSDDDKVSYSRGVVYATDKDANNNGSFVYAIYNTINPTEIDPYTDDADDDDTTTSNGCAQVDSSTFWLSLSSIVLAAALVAALIMLIVKAIRRKIKANKSDAKSHYKVSSRNKAYGTIKSKSDADDTVTETEDDAEVEVEETTDAETEEEYTYGEVLEDFGDETIEEVEEPVAEGTETPSSDEEKTDK